jgi:hypothetical protein
MSEGGAEGPAPPAGGVEPARERTGVIGAG